MRSIIALALIFGATFAGANTLLTHQGYQALTKESMQGIIAERNYVSKASVTAPAPRALRVGQASSAVNG